MTHRARPLRSFPWGPTAALLVVLGVASFFAWGLSTPELETVWRLEIELGLGERGPLADEELELLQRKLTRHPILASALTDDDPTGLLTPHDRDRVSTPYAYLIRSGPPHGVLQITVDAPPGADPVRVAARTTTDATTGVATSKAPFVWPLPPAGPFPQLIEVRLTPSREKGASRKHPLQPVRIQLRDKP